MYYDILGGPPFLALFESVTVSCLPQTKQLRKKGDTLPLMLHRKNLINQSLIGYEWNDLDDGIGYDDGI